MKNSLIFASFFVLSVTSAQASFYDGNELHKACQQKQIGFILGFVAGSYDKSASDVNEITGLFFDNLDPSQSKEATAKATASFSSHVLAVQSYCVAKNVQLGQLKDVYCNFLRNHPEKRHLKATVLLDTALAEGFPCQLNSK